jgi:hypothetical protein
MNVAAIPQLENADNRSCMFGEVIEITTEDQIPVDEYLYIDIDGNTFFSKEFGQALHLKSKALLTKYDYDLDNEHDRQRMEFVCRNNIIRKIDTLTTLLRIDGCKYIYRTPIINKIEIKVEEHNDISTITAKLKIWLFGKKDKNISLEAFAL